MPDAGNPFFCNKLEAWRHKMLHSCYFLQCDRFQFRIINPFLWIFSAISSKKSYLILMLFLLTYISIRTVKLPPAESWLVNWNFKPASLMQGWMIHRRVTLSIGRCIFMHLGDERHRESLVFRSRTQHNDLSQDSNQDLSIQSRAH